MADIVQFVPRPNPDRPTLLETVEIKGEEFLERAPALIIPPCWRFSDEMLERYPPDMEDDELNMQQRGRSNVTGY